MVLSCPEIAIQKSIVMEEHFNNVKRSQRDYSMSLKLPIVGQIDRGELSTTTGQRKYSIQSRSTLMTWLRKNGNIDGKIKCPLICPKRLSKNSWSWKPKLNP